MEFSDKQMSRDRIRALDQKIEKLVFFALYPCEMALRNVLLR